MQARTVLGFALMTILAAGCQSLTGKTAGENIDDTSIVASVKSKLTMERASNLTRVDVDAERGTVYLNGVVESDDQKARAAQLAEEVDGVQDVVNNIQVNPEAAAEGADRPEERSDAQPEAEPQA